MNKGEGRIETADHCKQTSYLHCLMVTQTIWAIYYSGISYSGINSDMTVCLRDYSSLPFSKM